MTWVYTESGHSKRSTNDVGAHIQNDIDNALAFHSIISCASELWDCLPKDHKQIGMYNENDINKARQIYLYPPDFLGMQFYLRTRSGMQNKCVRKIKVNVHVLLRNKWKHSFLFFVS